MNHRDELISRYEDGQRAVEDAVKSLSKMELDRRSTGQDWSAKEIVHHLADAEMAEGVRLRRILAEDDPILAWWDEAEYARKLHYDRMPSRSLAIFSAVIMGNVELLRSLSDDQWEKSGVHSRTGRYSVEAWLEDHAEHAHIHAAQIRAASGSAM